MTTSAWDFFERFRPVLSLKKGQQVSVPVNHPGVTESDINAIQEVVNRIAAKEFEVTGANEKGDCWLSIVIKRTA